jgi:hypothetical protein
LPSFVVALFLVAHGLLHASFVSPAPSASAGGPQWPFDLTRSWLLGPIGLDATWMRVVGIALLVTLLAGYLVAALAALGVLSASAFVPGVVLGSAASMGMLAVFFHPWLAFGVLIDAVLIWAVTVNGWRPV